MYFSILPDIRYDLKPHKFPFSSSDFTIAKNLFRRFVVNPDIFDRTVYYATYKMKSGERLDNVAYKFYENTDMDWIIALTNNITNIYKDLPMEAFALQQWAEKTYGSDVFSQVARYEITEDLKNASGTIFLRKGQIVDETFYNGNYQYNSQDSNNTIITVAGNTISKPVTRWDVLVSENDAKGEIYILRPAYVSNFITSMRKQSKYKKCSAYLESKIKTTLK